LLQALQPPESSASHAERDNITPVAIRAVCFDLGGVVARISYHWAEMLERNELPVPAHIQPTDELHAMPGFDAFQTGEISTDQYFAALATYLGDISVSRAEQVHRSMLIEPFEGVLELVYELHDRSIKTGCLSNTNAPHWVELVDSGRFPAIQAMGTRVASFEIDLSKPDPRAFRAFEEAIDCQPDEIVLFDDNLENCQTASQLGWTVLKIDPKANPAGQMRQFLKM
jgi:FMN phosphatase YigB (HAD superfamily)